MLTDNKFTREFTSDPRRRAVGAPTNVRWSDSQKIEAVTTYLMLGNLTLTSNVLKIPEGTLTAWKRTEWWQELVKEINAQENITLSNKLKKIVDKSLDLISDRLEHGDHIYDQKAGKLVRKPIGAKDLNKIAADMIDKKTKLQSTEATVIAEENIQSKLEKLAKSFEEFANKTLEKPAVVVTDVIYQKEAEVSDEGDNENAVHEEREERL